MKIYTRTGDSGETSLIGGTRVPKYHLRIEAYGTVDELNSYIGMIRDQDLPAYEKEFLRQVQERLFIIGSELASDPERSKMEVPDIKEEHVLALEQRIDQITAGLPELKHFVLPGGSQAASFCHIARCVCRRAERLIVHLSSEAGVNPLIIIYLNRLSDFLFVLARKVCHEGGFTEYQWIPSPR